MKSAVEVGTKMKSTMEVATEVEEANEMKTVMEVPTEWICKEAEMCDGSSNSSEIHSEWASSMIKLQPKWNLHWKAGVANKVKSVLRVSARTKYEMKSVI